MKPLCGLPQRPTFCHAGDLSLRSLGFGYGHGGQPPRRPRGPDEAGGVVTSSAAGLECQKTEQLPKEPQFQLKI